MFRRIALLASLSFAHPALAAEMIPTVPAAAKAAHDDGLPYVNWIAKAWKGDEDSIGALLLLEEEGYFENKGKAQDDHHRVLWLMLKQLGDDRFVTALDREAPVVQAKAVRAIALEAGPELAKFPKTAARRNADAE